MFVRRTAWLVFITTLSGSAVSAQVDLTGLWRPLARNEDGSGMDGDYAGLPLSAAGRARAQAWAPENFEVPEWVCRPHAWDFSLEAGASQLRISANIEDATQRLISLHGRLSMREQESDIWMDGRERPPDYARHSWSGFSMGEWEGHTLVQTATHLKEAYMRRWGPMRSDQATVRIRWKRIDQYLRATVIVYDPVYFDAPSRTFVERFRDVVRFESGPGIPQIERFGSPPRLEDLGSLTLPRTDVAALRHCHPGDCEVKLSAEAMRRFREEVEWSSPSAALQADEIAREMIFDLVRAYQAEGSAALGHYEDDDEPLRVAEQFLLKTKVSF